MAKVLKGTKTSKSKGVKYTAKGGKKSTVPTMKGHMGKARGPKTMKSMIKKNLK
jgi:hypothetical protein